VNNVFEIPGGHFIIIDVISVVEVTVSLTFNKELSYYSL
jgi:hypothetical protein